MAQFTHILNKIPGLRFISEELDIQSTPGRHLLMKQQLMTSDAEISSYLDKVEEFRKLLQIQSEDLTDRLTSLRNLKSALAEIHDITGTLNSLREGLVLDDIGLFEIKKFALLTERIIKSLSALRTSVVSLADISPVIALLDPDKQRIAHFYIYDSYSDELAALRKVYNEAVKKDTQQAVEIQLKCFEIEDVIREKLSAELRKFTIQLLENLSALAQLDVMLAKAGLALKLGLVKPVSGSQSTIVVEGLFNPEIRESLRLKGKDFQPVNITLHESPALVTGANMAGKTVLLKSIALLQYMYQYGFFLPAAKAVMTAMDKIMTSMDDEQSELKGLSSYASEMLKINGIIHAAKSGDKILALIDEPARTTNPMEGKAIVNALVDLLQKYKVTSIVTTHYSGIVTDCRKIRVVGLKTSEIGAKPTIENINDFMDYSLLELHPDEQEVPHEALSIAEILEVDEELISKAKKYLEN